jgi:hypothetical protein
MTKRIEISEIKDLKQTLGKFRAVWEGVSKGEEDGRRPPALRAGHPPNGHKPFGDGPSARRIRVGHGGPACNFRESMDTPSRTGLGKLILNCDG